MPLLLAPPVDEPAQVVSLTEAVNRPCVVIVGDVSPGDVARARATADAHILPLAVVLVAPAGDVVQRAVELSAAGADDVLVLPCPTRARAILAQLETDAHVRLLRS